jgi:hypothetical protein
VPSLTERGTNPAPQELTLSIADRKLAVKPLADYPAIVRSLRPRRDTAVTCELAVTLEPGEETSVADAVVDDLLCLMSLARGSLISYCYRREVRSDGAVQRITHWDHKTRPYCGQVYLISPSSYTDTRAFLETAFPNFEKQGGQFGLPIAIEAYLESKLSSNREISFLLACVAMECLRDRFARDADKEFIVKLGSSKKKAVKKAVEKALADVLGSDLTPDQLKAMVAKVPELYRPSMKSVLQELFDSVGLEVVLEEYGFIPYRDQVVHTGILGIDFAGWLTSYRSLINLLDRTFMAILGYEGYYLDYRSGYKRTMFRRRQDVNNTTARE